MPGIMEEDLIALIESVTSITPRPTKLEQSPALPGITYQRVNTDRKKTHSGSDGRAKPRFQLNVWGQNHLQCLGLVTTLIEGIDGFRGVVNGREFGSVFVVNQIDGREDSTDRDRIIVDVEIDHEE